MHIPFYYDDEGNMYNKTENRSIMHTFSCEYHGDGNVDRVIWTVLSENGTDVELGINNNSANFQEVTVELKISTTVLRWFSRATTLLSAWWRAGFRELRGTQFLIDESLFDSQDWY